jgi:23S rRNA (cytosine1962-C5)-methyltransferase
MPTTHPVIRIDTDQLPSGPWIFARQVSIPGEAPENGSLVEVQDRSGRYFAHGLFNGASDIRVRILSRGKKSEIRGLREFLLRKLAGADRVRRKLLRLHEVTDAYRIAHAEGDDLSGLIVDRLGPVLVCEHHALGFWRCREDVEWALHELYPDFDVIHTVPSNAAKKEGFEPEDAVRDVGIVPLREHEIAYLVRPGHGHKTGFFCDQRDNRLRVADIARGADVLDLCCNTAGFALQAKRLGARHVRAVDLDEVVLERARESAAENGLEIDLVHADAFDVLRDVRGARERPSVIVLDPHKIIRDRARMEEGLKRYGDLNTLAFECVRPGGLLATFSCSGALELATFFGMLFQSARRAGREVRLLETLGAAPDHPQRPEFSRSRYLKGALFAVD